jgi:hypothetical protein
MKFFNFFSASALNFQLTFRINKVAPHPAAEGDPAYPVNISKIIIQKRTLALAKAPPPVPTFSPHTCQKYPPATENRSKK